MTFGTNSVSVVIPNYNGLELLSKNLPGVIKASKNKENRIREIIIVDDASTDESSGFIKETYPEVILVKHKVNRGFSSTVNTGVRTAKSKLVCLLNTDVNVSIKFLEKLIVHFNNEKVFGVSLHEKGYSWARGEFKGGFVNHEPGDKSINTVQTFWVSGGSGVFRRDIWHQLKGMDEELLNPFYWEDIDLCYRAQKRGYICLWEPKAKVLHKHESTISKVSKIRKKHRIQERNQLIFIWKNITSDILFRKHIAGLLAKLLKHPGYFRVLVMALLKLPIILKRRKIEKKESSVSDESIFQQFK